ncbi:MAG: polyprenyl diphosphate synthase [Candidatus Moraniibacteriota bacterium]
MMPERENIPNHVAIIPDGNRRWAVVHNLAPWEGHEAGAKNTEILVRKAREIGVKELSIWGSSLENLKKRPFEESRELLRIYETYFTKLLQSEDIHMDKVHVRFIGRFEEQFPASLKKIVHRVIDATKGYDQFFLNFFLAYNGDDDMLSAIRLIADSGVESEFIDSDMVTRHLMTKEIAPVDYLIRTGDEPHLSAGFLMWHTQNSQLYFAKEYYPDFGEEAFQRAIFDFSERERRFGK